VPELEPGRRFGLDLVALAQMDNLGVLKIITARRGSELVGYISWVLQFDLESFGTLIAQQGSWYVKPGVWGAGWKLQLQSWELLRQLGVKWAYPHQRTLGRSAGVGRWFERAGCKPVMIVWARNLEDLGDA